MPTIITEDETGTLIANSYISIAELQGVATDRGIDLSALSNDQLAVLLIKAADYIESKEALFVGSRSFETQSLSWPRTLNDCNGITFMGVPARVKMAQAFLAIAVHNGVELLPIVDNSKAVISEKIGPIEVKYENAQNFKGPQVLAAEAFLQSYFVAKSFNVRVFRV